MFGVSLHNLVVHFPIALALVGCGYDAWAAYTGRTSLHRTGSGLIRLAALSAVLAAGTGLNLAGMSGLGSASEVTGHAGVALLGTAVLVTAAGVRYSVEVRSEGRPDGLPAVILAAEGAAAALVAAAAIMGHLI
jgi:uncharacterized membrane protein